MKFIHITFLIISFNSYAGKEEKANVWEENSTTSNSTKKSKIEVWAPTSNEIVNGQKVAEVFLKQITDNVSSPGWNFTHSKLKKDLSKEEWDKVFKKLLKSEGNRGKSIFYKAVKTNEFSGYTGDILVLVYVTEFEKSIQVETITLVKALNSWQIVGYGYQQSRSH